MIYHITEKAQWLLAKVEGKLEHESLESEGFIHCCTEALFPQVVDFHFKGWPSIYVLEIDEEKITSELKWEKVGGHSFPHIYGPIDVDSVVRGTEIFPNDEGIFEFPFSQLLH
ncbi:MAG: DUF952 domain-containing protein [Bdellovibrionales bacterium]|nr:DUF952 domain-containing protein [Bdellovibrionales bacterium]